MTDTCTSPDQQFLVYCSIHPTVHLVNLGSGNDTVQSRANIDEVCTLLGAQKFVRDVFQSMCLYVWWAQ